MTKTTRDLKTLHKIQDLQSLVIGFLVVGVIVLTAVLYTLAIDYDRAVGTLQQQVEALQTKVK